MTLYGSAPSSLRRHRERIGVAVLHAVAVLLVLAYFAPLGQATERNYRPVKITDRSATFAIDNLAGRAVVSARLTSTGGRGPPIEPARVHRAAVDARAQLRVSLPRSWRPARRAGRIRMTLRVRTRPAPPLPGSVLWKADAESSMASEWASNSSVPAAASPPNPYPSRTAQSAFSAQGLSSYRFEMRDGDYSYGERAELGQAAPGGPMVGGVDRWFRSGDERWIAMQYYIPTDWPVDNTWQSVFQIKPVGNGSGGPDIALSAGGNRLLFYGNDNVWGSTAGNIFGGAGPLAAGSYPLTRGKWIKLTWHVKFSANPSVGFLEVFGDLADGQGMRTLVPLRTRATLKYLIGTQPPTHLRVGIYRDPSHTAVARLYVDGITVATTRAAAETNAYAAG